MTALLESLTGLTLLEPAWLLLLLAVPLALLLRRRSPRASVLFAPAALLRSSDGDEAPLPVTWRARLVSLPSVLHVLCLVLAVVALARPVRRERVPPETRGIDILLCIDVSSSMTADDMDARRTRLDVAKSAAAEFVAGRPDDRIGLLTFARYPDLRCPPTLDHEALRAFLAEVEPVEGDGPEDATGIGTAVARAAQVLRGSAAASRVVVLLTDGVENVATAAKPQEIAPLHAGQLCSDVGVRVHTIAVGPPAPQTGSTAPGASQRGTQEVEALSARTGARFFVARDAAAVSAVYSEIDALERSSFDLPRYRFEDRFVPFALASLVLFAAGAFAGAAWLRVLP